METSLKDKCYKFIFSSKGSELIIGILSFVLLWIGGMLCFPRSQVFISTLFIVILVDFLIKIFTRDIMLKGTLGLDVYYFIYTASASVLMFIFAVVWSFMDNEAANTVICICYFIVVELIQFGLLTLTIKYDFSLFNKIKNEQYEFKKLKKEISNEGLVVSLSVETFSTLWELDKFVSKSLFLKKENLRHIDDEDGEKLVHVANTYKKLVKNSPDYENVVEEVYGMYSMINDSIKNKRDKWIQEQQEAEKRITVNKDLVKELKDLIEE